MKPWVLVLATLAALAVACGGDDSSPDDRAPAARAITIVADDVQYQAEDISIVAGEEVTLILSNTDNVEHDFQIDEIDADVSAGGVTDGEHGNEHDSDAALAVHADAGDDSSITFVANEAGTYEFYCTVPGHKDSGMVGTLIVTS